MNNVPTAVDDMSEMYTAEETFAVMYLSDVRLDVCYSWETSKWVFCSCRPCISDKVFTNSSK